MAGPDDLVQCLSRPFHGPPSEGLGEWELGASGDRLLVKAGGNTPDMGLVVPRGRKETSKLVLLGVGRAGWPALGNEGSHGVASSHAAYKASNVALGGCFYGRAKRTTSHGQPWRVYTWRTEVELLTSRARAPLVRVRD